MHTNVHASTHMWSWINTSHRHINWKKVDVIHCYLQISLASEILYFFIIFRLLALQFYRNLVSWGLCRCYIKIFLLPSSVSYVLGNCKERSIEGHIFWPSQNLLAFCCCDKQHGQNQLGEERDHFSLHIHITIYHWNKPKGNLEIGTEVKTME